MFDSKKILSFKKIIESLMIKYELFFSNRQYKNTFFKTEDEYNLIQKNLSSEIEIAEKDAKEFLISWFSVNFDNIKVIAYDSRFICMNKKYHRIGKVLLKNSGDADFHREIKERFFADTDFDIIVEAYEELPESIQKKFTF